MLPQSDSTGRRSGLPGGGSTMPDMPDPLLISAAAAARLCGRSVASWWRDHAAERVPAPACRAPGRTLWSVAELRGWVAAGCPDRRTWVAASGRTGGGR